MLAALNGQVEVGIGLEVYPSGLTMAKPENPIEDFMGKSTIDHGLPSYV